MNTHASIFNPHAWLLAVLLPAGAAHAQTPTTYPRLDPRPTELAADPAAPAPPALYTSAFAGLPSGVEPALDDWKKANAAVGQFPRGHADLLKWEQAQSAQPAAPAAQKP
ncbi:hypothetical protein SAMN05216350_101821 [Polaromonas sp. YR568]|uniref:hypothetical protein n=1 Tax=Polaromonas sp. YR568 TaxID=1855301 RepID=UPI0008F2AE02|nr:hypothetical protein [Polaromonas sp. YR568]SFU41107.1 hypothetical protein SAMN05216350_101821 [Polaromonas sp. YR568]